jgi:hypothetical protein
MPRTFSREHIFIPETMSEEQGPFHKVSSAHFRLIRNQNSEFQVAVQ